MCFMKKQEKLHYNKKANNARGNINIQNFSKRFIQMTIRCKKENAICVFKLII